MNYPDPPTLEDVAKAAGVSTATISRSINHPDKVSPDTNERVQRVIDALGYTPHFAGKTLASKRSNTVGAVIPTMANAMFASGLQAFQEELNAQGYTLLVASSGYDYDAEYEQIRKLIMQGADGLILIGDQRSEATREFLTARRIPTVVTWCTPASDSALYAGFNNVAAAADITRTVINSGHTQLAMIAGLSASNDRAAQRIDGVRNEVAAQGGAVNLHCVVEAVYTLDAGGDAFEQIMRQPTPPTAIVCGNDVLACGAIIRARQLGIDVPGTVSVTGFDDIDIAQVIEPALTTVSVPQRAMGKAAAERLLSLLDDQTTTLHSVELPTRVVHRDSLATR